MITFPLTAILIVILAAALATLVRWICQRLSAADWLCFFLALFTFGFVLLFVKVS